MPTITIHSLQDDMVVDFDYQPEERTTWDHPGCDERAYINSIRIGGVEVYQLVDSLGGMLRVEEAVLEAFAEERAEAKADAAIFAWELRA